MKKSLKRIISLVLTISIVYTTAGITSLAEQPIGGSSQGESSVMKMLAAPPTTGLTSLNFKEEINTVDKLTTDGWKWEPVVEEGVITSGTLTLQNANISTEDENAIALPANTTVVLADGSTNTVTALSYCNGAIQCDGALTFTGAGALNIVSTLEDDNYDTKGIYSLGEINFSNAGIISISAFETAVFGEADITIGDKATINIKDCYSGLRIYYDAENRTITAYGTLDISSESDTIDAGDFIAKSGSVIKLESEQTSVYSDNSATIENGAKVTVKSDYRGISGDIITVNGELTIDAANRGIRCDEISVRCKLTIKDENEAVRTDKFVTAKDSIVSLTAVDSVVSCYAGEIVLNGTTTFESGSKFFVDYMTSLSNTGTLTNNGIIVFSNGVDFSNTGTWHGSNLIYYYPYGDAPSHEGFVFKPIRLDPIDLTAETKTDGNPQNSIDKLATEGWQWNPADGGTLTFSGLYLETNIVLPAGSKIVLADGSANNITAFGGFTIMTMDISEAAIFSTGSITVTGTGSLNIDGMSSPSIKSGEGNIEIAGGNIVLDSYDECLKADLGNVKISSGTVKINSSYCGIFADTVTISGGDIEITNNYSNGPKKLAAGPSLMGKSDEETIAIKSLNNTEITGGTLNITSDYHGILSNKDIIISGGETNIISQYISVVASGNIVISGGKLNAVTEGFMYSILAGMPNDSTFETPSNITITGGEVSAENTSEIGAGILVMGKLDISNCTVTAKGSNYPAIVAMSPTIGASQLINLTDMDKTPAEAVVGYINTTLEIGNINVAIFNFGGEFSVNPEKGYFTGDYLDTIKLVKHIEPTPEPEPSDDSDSDDSGSSGGNNTNTITVVESPFGVANSSLISVNASANAFNQPVEVRMKDDAATKQVIKDALKAANSGLPTNASVFPIDISLYIKGTDTKVQPNPGETVEITCPVPADLLAVKDSIVVVCVIDGKLQVLPTKIVEINGVPCVVFTASHFSPYAFVVDTNHLLSVNTANSSKNNPSTGICK